MSVSVSDRVRCPDGIWPANYTARCCIGIVDPEGHVGSSLWLLFKIAEGKVTGVDAVTNDAADCPPDLVQTDPDLVASAGHDVWRLLRTDSAAFAVEVQGGAVQIKGDFRSFGRFAHRFLDAVGKTDLWDHVEDLFRFVSARGRVPPTQP